MAKTSKREAFASLASRFKKSDKPLLVRPPYCEDSTLFETRCILCEEKPCVEVCEENIIKLDENRLPFLSFESSGCTFCEECAKICPSEVLVLGKESVVKAKFKIDTNLCLAWNSVMCSSCRDACDEGAINFFGVFRPTVDMESCTGCGFCYGVCPPYALKYEAIKEK